MFIEFDGYKCKIRGRYSRRIGGWKKNGENHVGGISNVFTNGEFVVKFGEQAGQQWVQWQKIEREDRKYFARPIDYNEKPQYIIMEYLEFTYDAQDHIISEAIEDKLHEIARKYNLCDWSHNWGITTDGRAVIYDYAI